MRRKRAVIGIVALVLVFVALDIVLAASFSGSGGYSSTSHQYRPSSNTLYSSNQIKDYWPDLGDKETCKARQDVLLQISPVGCQPAVVRSDLLAEQNVPVFCQLDALQVNPLIDIDEIKNIRFTGKYPEGVVGAGFHPARAALKSRDKLLGDPIVNNIGYVVVVLKKNEKEDELPDFVSVNLTGKVEYDGGNAFGIGKSQFVLEPIASDQKWESLSPGEKNSFWQGRYFLRLEEAEAESATVSVYQGDKKISTVKVEKGKMSSDIYVPGMYCQAGVQVAYDGFVAKEERARIAITDSDEKNVIDVFEGSNFLNGKCKVREIEVIEERMGTVSLKCSGIKEEIVLDLIARDAEEEVLDSEELKGLNDEFKGVIDNYGRVSEEYPAEVEGVGKETYAERALRSAINFAKTYRQMGTVSRLLERLLILNPDHAASYTEDLNRIRTLDSSKAIRGIELNGKSIILELITVSASESKSNVKINVAGVTKDLKKGDIVDSVRIDGKRRIINISEIRGDRIIFSHDCGGAKEIKEGESAKVCGLDVKIQRIDFDGIAKVRLLPKVTGAATETNVTINIGIEKRAIKLNPEKTAEKIDNLNESVERWEDISSTLGDVNRGLKGACFAVAGVLTIKNFLQGIDGSSLARQQAMQGTNGWTARCENEAAGKYEGSIVKCFNDNSPLIEKEVAVRTAINAKVNGDIGNVGGESVIVNQKTVNDYRKRLESQGYDLSGLGKDVEGTEATPWTLADLRNYQYAKELEKNGYGDLSAGMISDINTRVRDQRESLQRFVNNDAGSGLLGGAVKSEGRVASGRFYTKTQTDVILSSAAKSKVSNLDYDTVVIYENAKKPIVSGSQSKKAETVPHAAIFGNVVAGKFIPLEVYQYDQKLEDVNGVKKVSGNLEAKLGSSSEFLAANGNPRFENLGSLYGNTIVDRDKKVRFFGFGPDKDMPALVPFDTKNGWYARIDSNYAVGDQKAGTYQSSGLPTRWRVCNVGNNNIIDIGDDICGTTDGDLNKVILGLSLEESKKLIRESSKAILDATRQRGQPTLRINGEEILSGNPISPNEGVQCHDFMSAEDCKLMFNVCDPVICPSTRCDFGGTYKVADVVQTGIVGSILLCLPNVKEGVVLPVCLTGIQAGIDGYTSILKAHRDCLQENLETGKLTGICDEITSVYMCEFFWKQAAPLAEVALPTIIEKVFLGGSRGGGEYRNVAAAWDNAEQSVDYFTTSYAGNSFKAFRVRSVAEAGTPFCKAFISAKAPSSFEALIEPDSPPQFHATFDSFIHSDATVPATSQYKVFYHIFAGKDSGVQFSVYLKNPGDSVFVSIPPTITVATDYIGRGESATETRDFTAPDGYKELCVRINNQESCGFKQVSTSFAVNYVRDQAVKGELGKEDITSERECISGSASLAALSNLNLQSAGEEALSPEVEKRGIVRVCSSVNPGGGTDPTRYVNVGHCGNENDRCWLDSKSVENALTDANKGVQGEVLKDLEGKQIQELQRDGKIISSKEVEAQIKAIESNGKDVNEKLKDLDNLFDLLVYNHHKARVLVARGDVLQEDFNVKWKGAIEVKKPIDVNIGGDDDPESDDVDSADSGVSASEVDLVGLRYEVGIWDHFAFRWNSGKQKPEVRMRLRAGFSTHDSDWLEDPGNFIYFATGAGTYDYERENVRNIMGADSWGELVKRVNEIAGKSVGVAKVYVPEGSGDNEFFEEAEVGAVKKEEEEEEKDEDLDLGQGPFYLYAGDERLNIWVVESEEEFKISPIVYRPSGNTIGVVPDIENFVVVDEDGIIKITSVPFRNADSDEDFLSFYKWIIRAREVKYLQFLEGKEYNDLRNGKLSFEGDNLKLGMSANAGVGSGSEESSGGSGGGSGGGSIGSQRILGV